MLSWNVIETSVSGGQYTLLNRSNTVIRFSRRVKLGFVQILVSMEDLCVPLAYTNDLHEIYFTYLPGRKQGDYLDGKIRLSCDADSRSFIERTLIHEIGHHVDEMEDISGDDRIVAEKRLNAKFMPDPYARKDVGEYVAVGFEVFYTGTKEQMRKMRRFNPRLWSAISRVHRKYLKF